MENEIINLGNALNSFLVQFLDLIFIPLILALLGRVGTYIYSFYLDIKNSQPEIIKKVLEDGSKIIYESIEQQYKNLGIDNEDKIKSAIMEADNLFKNLGYDFDETIITTFIESHIRKQKENGLKGFIDSVNEDLGSIEKKEN